MKKNQIKIRSNPYKKHNDYFWYEENGEWSNMNNSNSPLNNDRFISSPISHIAYDILEVITDKLNKSTIGIKIIFEGTDDDYDDLSNIKELYFSNSYIELERGNKKIKCAIEVIPQIEISYDKLRNFFHNYPDEAIEAAIARYTDAVKPEIAICVIGLYSSGKSAFINSIIGQEILPSDSDPTTAKIYKIRESEDKKISFKFKGENYIIEFSETKWKANKNPNSEIIELINKTITDNSPKTEDQFMYWTLYALNDFAKKESKKRHDELVKCAEKLLDKEKLKSTNDDDKKIKKLLNKFCIKELVAEKEITENELDDAIEVYVNFVHSCLSLDKYKFVIYDTPGSNSAMYRDHIVILKESLKQTTNGLPVFITDPDNMDSNDNKELTAIIDEFGGALDISSMMLVVNKCDGKAPVKLGKKVETINDSFLRKWKTSRVYFVSSIIGLGGKKTNPDDEKEWIDDDYYTTFSATKHKFFNPEISQYLILFKYNIMSRDSFERISNKAEAVNGSDLLLWNSGIPCIEEEIEIFAQKQSLYNKCSQATQYLTEAASIVQEAVKEAKKEADILKIKIEKKIDDKKQELLNKITEDCNKKMKQFADNYSEKVVNQIVSEYINIGRIIKVVDDILLSSPGKNDNEKLNPFNEKIEESFQTDIQNYSERTYNKTLEYWESCADELRESLLKIVVESPALTQEQKDILKRVVLEIAQIPSDHKNLNIKNTSAVQNKGKRFLWILWYMTYINKVKTIEIYHINLSETISDYNKNNTVENQKSFQAWIDQLKNKLISVVSSFNPVLASLCSEFEKQIIIIDTKEDQNRRIENEIITIEMLLKFEVPRNEWSGRAD